MEAQNLQGEDQTGHHFLWALSAETNFGGDSRPPDCGLHKILRCHKQTEFPKKQTSGRVLVYHLPASFLGH